MPSSRVIEAQSRFVRKQDELAEYLASGRGDGAYAGVDLQRAEQLERELNDLADELKRLQRLEDMEDRHTKARDEWNQLDHHHIHATPHGSGAPTGISHGSLGEQVKDAWAKHQRAGRKVLDQEFSLDLKGWLGLGIETKATMLTTAGWAPEVTRIPRIAEKIAAPVEVLDLFPVQTTDQAGVAWMEETTSTSNAAELAEAALYPEAGLAFTPRSSTVRKIGTRLPVSDEQLADVPGIAQFIDTRLRGFVRKRLDAQVLVGDGIAPNLLGLMNTPNVLVQTKGAEAAIDAIYRGIVRVRVEGQATPTAIILHPNDLQDIRLLTANGIYVFGSPADAGVTRLWGLPVTETSVISEGTVLVGDFTHSTLWLRQVSEVEVGLVDDQFIRGLQTIRASLRVGLAVYRSQAFCLVTGI